MRRILQLSMACLAAGVVSACGNLDQVENTGIAPTGGVRFINAVPDTGGSGGLDFRFVDIVENNAHYNITFRNSLSISGDCTKTSGCIPASTQIQFKATAAGERHFRIFLDDESPAIASTVLIDSVLTVEPDHRYTMLLWGNARGGANPMRLTVIDETYDPGDQIGLRVINTTSDPIDVSQYVFGGAPAATPTWAAVPPMSISSYVNVTPNKLKFNVRPAGGGASLFIDPVALVGQANGTQANGCFVGVDCDATPGTTAAGSAVTAVIFPPSVAGSKAPQTDAFTVPAILFMWDHRPIRAPGT